MKNVEKVDYANRSGIPSFSHEWLNSQEAAAYLRIGEYELRNLVSNGVIPYYKLGKRNRYLLTELREHLLRSRRGV